MEIPWRLIKSLTEKKVRDKLKMTLVEGPGPCKECLSMDVEVRYLVMTRDFAEKEEGKDLLGLSGRMAKPPRVFFVDGGLFEKMSETKSPQGVLMVVPFPFQYRRVQPGRFWGKELVVVGVDVQDPGNVGTIIRTSAACGATRVAFSSGSADLFSPKVIRSSAGSIFRVKASQWSDYRSGLESMVASGVKLVMTSPVSGCEPWKLDLTQDIAIVLGNEGSGLSDDILQMPGDLVSLPMPGGVESLNVASAASMILYEVVRQRLLGPGAALTE